MEKLSEKEKKDKIVQDELKSKGEIPRHVAIIMDGNGRWAKEQGKSRVMGHKEGVNTVRKIVEVSGELGIKFLTLYTFSTENWKRPKSEITVLMKLLIMALKDETDRLHKNDIKLVSIGDMNVLPDKVAKELNDAIEKTKNNKKMTLNLAISYSGRWDIINAIQKMYDDCKKNKITKIEINEKLFSAYLTTADIPDPDLLIRTGGEFRISNFLLWQSAYSEFYVEKKYWPEFGREDLYHAIEAYQKRERRFGMVSEQLSSKN